MTGDRISRTVIQAGIAAASDEMFLFLRKTAMSPIIHEVLDVGTGITDADGRLLGSGAGIPTFVGVLDKSVKRIIELHGTDSLVEGDMFVTNDPNYGGVTHLSDVVIAMPVFWNGRCLAWSATIAHWSDIGGITPGSMSTRASEIFQEGLRLPAVRLFAGGEPVTPVLEIIFANSRLPDFARGDLWAQIAACRRATARISRLVDTYGLEEFECAIAELFTEGRRRAADGLKKLPKGSYSIDMEQDDGEVWHAGITIGDDRFQVDLRDNPAQKAGPYNTSRDGAVISAQMIFKAVTDPQLFANEGSFAPLEVLTEPGTIFHAIGSAPHGYYFETRIRLFDMLWRCLAKHIPEQLPAGHFASICGTVIAGRHPDTGRDFTMVEPQMGGWGATRSRPGLHCMFSSNHGETFNCPVEICEARYGIEVGWKRLNTAVGRGRHDGGAGLSICYRPRSKVLVAVGLSHNKTRVWGSNGGSQGGKNSLSVVRRDGGMERFGYVSDLEVDAGDDIVIETAGGGGWGKGPSASRENGGVRE